MRQRFSSVNDIAADDLIEAFEVRDLQSANGFDHHTKDLVGPTALSEGLSRRPQEAEDLRPIESLTFTMLAETHVVACLG